MITNEGGQRAAYKPYTSQLHTTYLLSLQIPPQEQIWGGADKRSLPQLGLGSWQVWATRGQEGAFVPYSVFPKLFAFSLPGACSTILPQMQCKQERKTERVRGWSDYKESFPPKFNQFQSQYYQSRYKAIFTWVGVRNQEIQFLTPKSWTKDSKFLILSQCSSKDSAECLSWKGSS